tara:strand:+ start:470 stop:583 length:114 start_codon:yes stop_codon:yes gene_type:complete
MRIVNSILIKGVLDIIKNQNGQTELGVGFTKIRNVLL